MESLILKVLSFDVAVPTIHLFCERFLKDLKASSKTSSLAMVLIPTCVHHLFNTDITLKLYVSVVEIHIMSSIIELLI